MSDNESKNSTYKHLSLEEMIKIEAYLNTNESISNIAKYLNLSKSTIDRELKRNENKKTCIYKASFAQKKSRKRKHNASQKEFLKNDGIRKLVVDLIWEKYWNGTLLSTKNICPQLMLN